MDEVDSEICAEYPVVFGPSKGGDEMDSRTKRQKVTRTLAISFGIVLILGSIFCLLSVWYGCIWEAGYYIGDREEGELNATIAFLIITTATMLASGLSLVLGPSKIEESEPEETKAQAEAGSKPRTIVIIFGIILLLAAVLFGCVAAGGLLYTPLSRTVVYHVTPGEVGPVEIDVVRLIAESPLVGRALIAIPIVAILIAIVLAGGIRLVFGPYKIPPMYAASAISLAIMSLASRPWFVGCTTEGHSLSATCWIVFNYREHTTNFNLVGLLFVILLCLGAVLFSILWARKTRERVLRTISWICGIVGGLGAILAVVDLIRFLPM